MPFCKECGAALKPEDKFCPSCGKAVNDKTNDYKKIEYAGKVIICPSCGAEVRSFEAICPYCMHEFNSVQLTPPMKEFVKELSQLDRTISAGAPQSKIWIANKVSESWNESKRKRHRFFWVLINILLVGFPLFIRNLLPLIGIGVKSGFTKAEKQKAAFIEDYVFPNERETILEAELYIQARINDLIAERAKHETAQWIHIWHRKSEQIKKKASIALSDDAQLNRTIHEIDSAVGKLKRTLVIHTGLSLVLSCILIGLFAFKTSAGNKLFKKVIPLQIPETKLSAVMPQISGAKGEVNDGYTTLLKVKYFDISDKQFEDYKEECIKSGYTIDMKESSSSFNGFNSDGYEIYAYHNYNDELEITVHDVFVGSELTWPDTEAASLIPKIESPVGEIKKSSNSEFSIKLQNISIGEYENYVKECIKMGFNSNIDQDEDSFKAYDIEENQLSISYEGFSVISITVEGCEKLKYPYALTCSVSDIEDKALESGKVYSCRTDDSHLYVATAASSSVLQIELWEKPYNFYEPPEFEKNIGTININDSANDFSWLDSSHTAFSLRIVDRFNSFNLGNTGKIVAFTVDTKSSEVNKGTNCEIGSYYSYQFSKREEYRAFAISESLVKFEFWECSYNNDEFVYRYDLGVLNMKDKSKDFQWLDSAHRTFSLTIQDPQNYSLRDPQTFIWSVVSH